MFSSAGIAYFWGLTIDPLVCMGTVLVVGLCVDYSVHIAHAFADASGTSGERASEALVTIGPAIFNGGTTTFLVREEFCSYNQSY